MPATIMSNKKYTSATIHFTAANSSLVVAGNSSVSNIAAPGEDVTGATIIQAVWGCDGAGSIQVFRGPTLVGVYDSTGQHEYAGCGMPINVNAVGNLDVKFVGSSNSFIVLEVQKSVSSRSGDYLA